MSCEEAKKAAECDHRQIEQFKRVPGCPADPAPAFEHTMNRTQFEPRLNEKGRSEGTEAALVSCATNWNQNHGQETRVSPTPGPLFL